MKDEHQARVEALKLTQMVPGITSQESRIEIAAKFERYILHGHSGEAPKAQTAPPAVPVTEGKAPPKRRGKGASEVPEQSGEASDEEQEGETDPSEFGRPSSRVAGVSV